MFPVIFIKNTITLPILPETIENVTHKMTFKYLKLNVYSTINF